MSASVLFVYKKNTQEREGKTTSCQSIVLEVNPRERRIGRKSNVEHASSDSMSTLRVVVSAVVSVVGVGIALVGFEIWQYSNPATYVQVGIWSIIGFGLTLIVLGIILALRWR